MSSPQNPDGPPRNRMPFTALRSGRRRLLGAAALVGAFAVGGGVTALALQGRQPALVMLAPTPIAAMHDWSPVAVKGEVAEIFGNKFIVQDESGRALVETGRTGEDRQLVAKSETITVQGRFEHGFIHAQAISHGDGRNDLVGPAGPPHGGPRGGPLALRARTERPASRHPAKGTTEPAGRDPAGTTRRQPASQQEKAS